MNFRILLLSVLLIFSSCKKEQTTVISEKTEVLKGEKEIIKYAQGFSITNFDTYSVLEIKNPWPKSELTFKYAIIDKSEASKNDLNPEDYDGIITTPIEKIVVTSTTHIPALELLNVDRTLVGFPGTDYVSSEKTRKRINNGAIRELGKNEDLNTEVLLDIAPNAVVAFGVDGKSKSLKTIKQSGIPVLYNGDWVEKSPLAKAEWLKFFGVLYNKKREAELIFNNIEKYYNEAKDLALNTTSKPTVLSGAMHKDVWYLPNGESTEAQLLKDANVNYLWSDTKGTGSLSLNFEVVFNKAKDADLWLSPSYYPTLESLEKANAHYTKFEAFKNKNVYSFSNTTGKTGGVLYYELGISRPDLVLKDIIKICHPELLKGYEPNFFKPLN